MANLQEGGRRLAVVGINMLKVAAGAGSVALLCVLVTVLPSTRWLLNEFPARTLLLLSTPITFWLTVLGTSLLAAGWVVKGFGMPPSANTDPAGLLHGERS